MPLEEQVTYKLKKRYHSMLTTAPYVKAFAAGAVSGTCSTLLFQPLDLLKTRLQVTNRMEVRSMFATAVQVVQNERFFGLYKGLAPSLVRCMPGVGLYFGTYSFLKGQLGVSSPSPLQAIAIGATARSITGAIMLPVTVIKIRFESGIFNYNSVGGAMMHIVRVEGAKALYSGLLPTLIRDAPYSGIYLMFYTQLNLIVPEKYKDGPMGVTTTFGRGIIAGILASVLTQPADVVKTTMQLHPSQFPTTMYTIVALYKGCGMKVYFRGLVPRALRKTLMSAMSWTLFEALIKQMGLK